jgi:Rrf2 family transcriptional regulator, iron-sulfur cluster assembly transcription factor
MIRYGKTTQTAIALMSRLAEVYDEARPLSSLEIARDRNLSRSLVAKLLTVLAQAGLVTGSRGPGGGYRLAKQPRAISLHDITQVFERSEDTIVCPFGPGWCGREEKCPLHDDYARFVEQFDKHLRATRLNVFLRDKRRQVRPDSKKA